MSFDFFKSALDNWKEKLQNPFHQKTAAPFAGTFLIALIFYNWELLYSLLTFDSDETRLTKIDIIKKYLEAKGWLARVGWPALYSLISIAVYYFFNHISLGITIFFNRWFKTLIFKIFDRGKLVSSDEIDKERNKINITLKRYEELRRRNNESLVEIDGWRDKFYKMESDNIELKTKLDVEYNEGQKLREVAADLKKKEIEVSNLKHQLNSEQRKQQEQALSFERDEIDLNGQIEALNIYIENIRQDEKEIRILNAKYGSKLYTEDVTDKLKNALSINRDLTISNEIGNSRLLKYGLNEMNIIYSSEGEVKEILAMEGAKLSLQNRLLIVTETDESKRVQSQIEARRRLAKIFQGVWVFSNTPKDDVITVDDNGGYYVNGKLSNILIDILIEGSDVFFKKAKIESNMPPVIERLNIANEKIITGTHAGEKFIQYRKIR